MKNIVVITAAGSGVRMNLNVPKQFYEVNDKPLIVYTLETFESSKLIDGIVLVTQEDRFEQVQEYCRKFDINKVVGLVPGGSTNGESIYNGIMYAKDYVKDEDFNILIHDGDRCMIAEEIIEENIKCLNEHGSAVTVIPVVEAIYEAQEGVSTKYIPRNNLYRIQTPYSYRYSTICDMYKKAEEEKMDYKNTAPCIMMQLLGIPSHIMNGSETNFKITNPDDLVLFKALKK